MTPTLALLLALFPAQSGQQALDQMRTAVTALKSVKGQIVTNDGVTNVQGTFYILGSKAFGYRHGTTQALFDGKKGWLLSGVSSYSETDRSDIVTRMMLVLGYDQMVSPTRKLAAAGDASKTTFNDKEAIAVKLAGAADAKATTTLFLSPTTKLPVGYSIESDSAKLYAAYLNITPNPPFEIADFKFVPPKGAVDLEAALATKALIPVGNGTPPLALLTPTGIRVDLAETRKKAKAALVIFWDPESPRSVAEVKRLEKLRRSLQPQGLETIGVIPQMDPKPYRAFMEGNGIGFKSGADFDGSTIGSWAVKSDPTVYLITQKGTVAARYFWDRSANLNPALKKLGFKLPPP